MGFADDVRAFNRKIETQERDIFTGVVDLAHESIVEGSQVTGAPGQPVDTGALKASWVKSYPSKDEAVISTNLVYAPIIEDGERRIGSDAYYATKEGTQKLYLRSEVGGFHSVALTLAGFDKIVESVTNRVVGNESGSATGGNA